MMRIVFECCYLLCLCQSLAAFTWMPMSDTISKSILASSSSSDFDGRRKKRTASQQERIDEERRRLSRKNDVVIGKTSAVSGAKDFELNVQKTEMEWRQQATPIECQIREYTQKALDALHMVRQITQKDCSTLDPLYIHTYVCMYMVSICCMDAFLIFLILS